MLNSNTNTCLLCRGPLKLDGHSYIDTRFGIKETYTIGSCAVCCIKQIVPTPPAETLQELYECYYNFCGEHDTLYTKMRGIFYDSFLYQMWLAMDGDISFHRRQGTGRLLDVGCNEGRGLIIYRKNGYTVEGLELNRNAAALARSHGFIVHTDLIEDFLPQGLYDVVVLSNVIEHSLNPHDMLSHVARLLKPGGAVWISCPNNESWMSKIFGKSWINWHVPFHIVHFSDHALRRLLNSHGFSVTEFRDTSPALWAAQSLIASLFSQRGHRTGLLRNPLLILFLMFVFRGILFPFLWLGDKFGTGDCLIVTAKKDNITN
jgi:2-polyprenyl-3-methyl-5-hydroxy-6-metoxy-1,4-benzoquinol methylase